MRLERGGWQDVLANSLFLVDICSCCLSVKPRLIFDFEGAIASVRAAPVIASKYKFEDWRKPGTRRPNAAFEFREESRSVDMIT